MAEQTDIERAREAGRDAAIERLTAEEQMEYERYVRSQKPSLSLQTNQKLFELYLAGVAIPDIISLNPALGPGAIQKARVDGRWDERREAHYGEVQAEVSSKLKQTAAEVVDFLSLMLHAAHKEQKAKLLKFIQSGDPADLGELRITSMRGYKEVIETLAKLVGTGSKQGAGAGAPIVPVSVTVNAPGGSGSVEAEGGTARWTADDADAIRAAIEKKRLGE